MNTVADVDIIEINATINVRTGFFIFLFLRANKALKNPVFSAKPTPNIANKNITKGVNVINVVNTFPIKYLNPSLEKSDSTDTKEFSTFPVTAFNLG